MNNNLSDFSRPSLTANRWAVFFMAVVCLSFLAVAGGIYFWYQVYWPINRADIDSVVVKIEKGQGVREIAEQLAEKELIRSVWCFKFYVWLSEKSAALQAGEYSLSRNLNSAQLLAILTGGQVVDKTALITFPEGFTLKQIKARLIGNGVATAQDFNGEIIDGFQLQYKFLSDLPPGTGLEGFLFPDTYRFNKEIKKEDILKKFLDNFDKKLTPALREEISRQGKKLYDIITLASIVQQEAVSEEEMPLIAGVFASRLRIGMPLESDATINYITGKKMRQPLLEDTKIKSPYNTYLNKGLPPTPICNPGLAAIKAAIEPVAGDYLYFLHPLDQPAVFSKTLDEHNKNRVKYLK